MFRTLPRRAPSPSKRRDIRSGGGYHLTRLVSERWKLSFSNLGPFLSRSGPEGPGGPPKPLFWPPRRPHKGPWNKKGRDQDLKRLGFVVVTPQGSRRTCQVIQQSFPNCGPRGGKNGNGTHKNPQETNTLKVTLRMFSRRVQHCR